MPTIIAKIQTKAITLKTQYVTFPSTDLVPTKKGKDKETNKAKSIIKEDNNLYLKIVIDRDEIIDIDKCVEVTNIINPILDREDPIKESYTLDVSTKEKGR